MQFCLYRKLTYQAVKNCKWHSMSPRHSTSVGWIWTRKPLVMEGNSVYTESTVVVSCGAPAVELCGDKEALIVQN